MRPDFGWHLWERKRETAVWLLGDIVDAMFQVQGKRASGASTGDCRSSPSSAHEHASRRRVRLVSLLLSSRGIHIAKNPLPRPLLLPHQRSCATGVMQESIANASMHIILPDGSRLQLFELRVPHESSAATHDFPR